MERKIKLIIWLVIILWLSVASVISYLDKDKDEEQVLKLVKQLFRDRKAKDNCLNSLTYNDSQLVFQGLSNKCQENNEIMETTYQAIINWITFPYQQTDKIVEEAKNEKFTEEVKQIEQTTGSAVDKLNALLSTGL